MNELQQLITYIYLCTLDFGSSILTNGFITRYNVNYTYVCLFPTIYTIPNSSIAQTDALKDIAIYHNSHVNMYHSNFSQTCGLELGVGGNTTKDIHIIIRVRYNSISHL